MRVCVWQQYTVVTPSSQPPNKKELALSALVLLNPKGFGSFYKRGPAAHRHPHKKPVRMPEFAAAAAA